MILSDILPILAQTSDKQVFIHSFIQVLNIKDTISGFPLNLYVIK